MSFTQEKDGIYLLKVPFEDLYTSVFALNAGEQWVLCDTACGENDVQNYILPALLELDARPDYLFCSHAHADHAGGLSALRKVFPDAKVVTEPTVLPDRFEVISLKGHTEDSLAIYDRKTKTLLSFDCLQQYGIGKYRNGVTDRSAYLKSIALVCAMDIDCIIFAHDYDPCGHIANGKPEVQKALDICREAVT